MKKLIVLSLVLAVVGLANASLTLVDGKAVYSVADPVVGGINVYIGTSAGKAVLGAYEFRTVGAPVSAPAFTDYSAQDAIDYDFPWVAGGFVNLVWGDSTTTPNPAGEWFKLAVVGNFVAGTAESFDLQIDVMNAFDSTMESLYLSNAIPEPMTMGLLSLGALFIRKRK